MNRSGIFTLKDGEPCSHPGCLNHITHPCEGCGRIGGRMPILICRKCGGKTNTAVCDYRNSKDDKADRCFVQFIDATRRWEKGCAYDDTDNPIKDFCDDLINTKNK